LVLAAVIGIPAAIYLAEFSPAWLRNIIKPCVELLVGIPSIVLGFFGLIVIVTYIRDSFGGYGECILAGWIILAIMTLPHVISISEDSIRAVPKEYKEGSLALGATQLQTIKKVILPNARSGILAAMVLGMGNAIGETMAVLMVNGISGLPMTIKTAIVSPIAFPIPKTIAANIPERALGNITFFIVCNCVAPRASEPSLYSFGTARIESSDMLMT